MRGLFFFLLFVISQTGVAQKFSSGYVITNAGDTIRGFIIDGTDTQLASIIEFKNEKTSSPIIYSPENLQGFGFDYGRNFKRFSYQSAPGSLDSTAVFAKKNFDGRLSLYSLDKRSGQSDFFIVNNITKVVAHLTQPKARYVKDLHGREYSVAPNYFIGQISAVKDKQVSGESAPTKLKYTDISITKNILRYNENFATEYPIKKYVPKKAYFYDLTVGTTISNAEYEHSFRAAAYRNKYNPEKSRTMSMLQGVSYSNWSSNAPVEQSSGNVYYNQQFISLIPIGINIHTDGKSFVPYMYLGVGLLGTIESYHEIADSKVVGDHTAFSWGLTANAGAGVKIKIKSSALILEFTPSSNGNGLYANVGYSF